jgi:hypothetical protein
MKLQRRDFPLLVTLAAAVSTTALGQAAPPAGAPDRHESLPALFCIHRCPPSDQIGQVDNYTRTGAILVRRDGSFRPESDSSFKLKDRQAIVVSAWRTARRFVSVGGLQ